MENYSNIINPAISGQDTGIQAVNPEREAIGKTSFLIFKNNKYIIVRTENIAFFHIKYESSMIVCFDRQEYFVNYSLDHIQELLSAKQFFRVNRQCLINFHAIRDVELYFSRKLLVNPTITVSDKFLIRKEKAGNFLEWLDNR